MTQGRGGMTNEVLWVRRPTSLSTASLPFRPVSDLHGNPMRATRSIPTGRFRDNSRDGLQGVTRPGAHI